MSPYSGTGRKRTLGDFDILQGYFSHFSLPFSGGRFSKNNCNSLHKRRRKGGVVNMSRARDNEKNLSPRKELKL